MYNDEDLFTLEKISLLKILNLPLKDIVKVLSKVTIEQLLYAHKDSLHKKLKELQHSIKYTNTLLNIVHLEGDLNWEQLMPLVKNSQEQEHIDRTWDEYTTEDEQTKLKEILPKMEQDGPPIRKWMNLIRRIDGCLERGDTPDSKKGKLLRKTPLFCRMNYLMESQELGIKFFEIRKSPDKISRYESLSN